MASRVDANRINLAGVVGVNLRKLSGEAGLTTSSLAKSVGVSTSIMTRMVNGEQIPSFLQALALAEALDCSLDALVEGL